eukprot:6588_1
MVVGGIALIVCVCKRRREAEKDLKQHVQGTEMVDGTHSKESGEGADTTVDEKKEQANAVIPMQMKAPFIGVPVHEHGQNADLPKVRDTDTDSGTDEGDEMYENENNREPVVTSGGQGQTKNMSNNLLINNEQVTGGEIGFGSVDNVEPVFCTPENE